MKTTFILLVLLFPFLGFTQPYQGYGLDTSCTVFALGSEKEHGS
jgi:hypothetical protein